MIRLMILLMLPLMVRGQQTSSIVLVQKGDVWKFYDQPSYPGDDWFKKNYNDAQWDTGRAELGFGDGDEVTIVNRNRKGDDKHLTTYFRKSFDLKSADKFKSVELNIKRDDGAIVYINGNEVFRTNMPKGNVAFDTKASSGISGGNENAIITTTLDPKVLSRGKNVIAVEVHQDSPTSSDLSFDLSLSCGKTLTVTRGPYLQSGTPTSMIVRWRTSDKQKPRVFFGTSVQYSDSVFNNEESTDHIVQLNGLKPNTKYYYSITSVDEPPPTDSNYFFITPPEDGSASPVRIWTMGDFGNTGGPQVAAINAYSNFNGSTYTNLLLWLGDDAYPSGTDEQYGTNVFIPYKKFLSQSLAYSTSGNHDLYSSSVLRETGPYFDIFSFPKNGECGGVKSGSEAYYSFNYGNIHFICLESNIDSFGTRANEMIEWLKQDLAANKSKWTIAFFHFALYSKGYHDSDVNQNMMWMRKNAGPILERNNVDLVLSGHLHDYERSPLLNGFYGDAASFNKSMVVDIGKGKDTVEYKKTDKGTMYVIAGCMGEWQPVQNKSWPHPATVKTFQKIFGTLVLDINADKIEGRLITKDAKVEDYFIIRK